MSLTDSEIIEAIAVVRDMQRKYAGDPVKTKLLKVVEEEAVALLNGEESLLSRQKIDEMVKKQMTN